MTREFSKRLRALIEAAVDLDASWEPGCASPAYPSYLPSFEEFLLDLMKWRDAVIAAAPKQWRVSLRLPEGTGVSFFFDAANVEECKTEALRRYPSALDISATAEGRS